MFKTLTDFLFISIWKTLIIFLCVSCLELGETLLKKEIEFVKSI